MCVFIISKQLVLNGWWLPVLKKKKNVRSSSFFNNSRLPFKLLVKSRHMCAISVPPKKDRKKERKKERRRRRTTTTTTATTTTTTKATGMRNRCSSTRSSGASREIHGCSYNQSKPNNVIRMQCFNQKLF